MVGTDRRAVRNARSTIRRARRSRPTNTAILIYEMADRFESIAVKSLPAKRRSSELRGRATVSLAEHGSEMTVTGKPEVEA
jgi:hypothetical protein